MLILWYLKNHVVFSALQNLTLFQKLCRSLLKYAQKHHIKNNQKNSFIGIIFKSKNCENGQKRGKIVVFFGPGGTNFDHFFTIFCKSPLNMPKNIILKNQKNSFTRKISKSEKLRKWPKKGPIMAVFWPWRVEFWPFFHNFLQITSKYAQKHHIKK